MAKTPRKKEVVVIPGTVETKILGGNIGSGPMSDLTLLV